ncbi:chemotaxis response regulator containing a CheY-like receiver domain and a methylesterase domain [Mycobacteroides abscessus subsp. abscessus]|nr:chemotaxis response regulator containing a CheY-like receiver domain and a methylesterase domain [Mycobacteroides abscessus subsp. abscessus]
MSKIKVLIVDDSAFMRKLIQDFLTEDPRMTVVGSARNGEDAIKKVIELEPDVVTLDVEMPILNGIEALKRIMSEKPTPVVMLSSTTKQGAENTILAIQYGATDFITKPSGAISLDLHKVKEELVEKVVSASKANIKQLVKLNSQEKNTVKKRIDYSKIEPSKKNQFNALSGKKLVCIGTSTGGPRALQQVITKLPKTIDAPVLVVQHMPAGFTKSLAVRLDSLSEVHVKEAEEGDIIQKGTVYIAPGGLHLKLKWVGANLAIQLDQSPPRNGHRPAVDVMFESCSELSAYAKISVIMTGMGSDGTKGLIKLKESGNVVAIAESEETSIVFGMPKAAIATKLVDEVKNVDNIAETIMKYV